MSIWGGIREYQRKLVRMYLPLPASGLAYCQVLLRVMPLLAPPRSARNGSRHTRTGPIGPIEMR